MKMTGMAGVSSFSLASAMTPVWVSQRAPAGQHGEVRVARGAVPGCCVVCRQRAGAGRGARGWTGAGSAEGGAVSRGPGRSAGHAGTPGTPPGASEG